MYQNDSFLTDTLAVVAQNWVDEFRKTWGLDALVPPSGMERLTWEFAKVCDQIASRIVAATRTLERNQGNLDEFLNTLRDKLGLAPEQDTFFAHLLEAHLVDDLEDELDRMRLRALKLVRYLVDAKSERVRAYLARVGACFLRGLETETVVMCGAVIDASLQELLDDEEVRASGIRCGRYVSFGNRIEFMGQSGRWDEATVKIAFGLAEERNNAIHAAPELARGVDEVMEDLILLLGRIP
jgi:hypothetical protein